MKTALIPLMAFSLFCVPAQAAPAASRAPLPEAARLLEEGHFEEAAEAFEKLSAELRPGDQRAGSVWRGLGVSYANLGEDEKAIAAFTASLETEPQSALTLIYLGTCYRLADRAPEAIPAFLKALALDPKSERVHDELRQCYASLGERYGYDTELAARELYHTGKLLEISPEYAKGFPEILVKLKYLRAVKTLFEGGETRRIFREGAGPAEAGTPALPEDGISADERRAGIALAEKF
jgi:tetratricopeptide (TPR) repeat protein